MEAIEGIVLTLVVFFAGIFVARAFGKFLHRDFNIWDKR